MMGHGLAKRNLQNTGKLTEPMEWKSINSLGPSLPLATDTWLLKFDANAHPGHSGSPLVTPDGLVVGAECMIVPQDTKSNWAVHVRHIRELVARAAPDTKLPIGQLSVVERVRLDHMRTARAHSIRNARKQEEEKQREEQLRKQQELMLEALRVEQARIEEEARRRGLGQSKPQVVERVVVVQPQQQSPMAPLDAAMGLFYGAFQFNASSQQRAIQSMRR